MIKKEAPKKLKKELRLLDVFVIGAGTTLSGGLFLLPGLAAKEAGSAIILAYIIAAIPLIPAMLSTIELATAMPRAGGIYYFLDRTMGPLLGTIGGLGTWLSLILKVAFALIGMGAYINIFVPSFPIVPVAILIAILLGILNVKGSKLGSAFQVFLVGFLLIFLSMFIGEGIFEIDVTRFYDVFDIGTSSLLATSGLVYVSYIGISKVISLSEEIKDPERNIPLGVFLALGLTLVVYVLVTVVMVGVIPMEELKGALTPAALAAEKFSGKLGVIFISSAALLSFISVANAGTMSASRYPLAMSRDHLLPPWFRNLSKNGTPLTAVISTVIIVILTIILFDPLKIAKLASAFQLLIFSFICIAVIVMRESKIQSYDPGFLSPLYPYTQIFGVIGSFWLIIEMGIVPIVFSSGLIIAGILWYTYYAKSRVHRNGAVYHIFERLGRERYTGLERELRGILKEKGLREKDPFDEVVLKSRVMDLNEHAQFEHVCYEASKIIAGNVSYSVDEIFKQFMDGTKIGATPVTHGVALPHLHIEGLSFPMMVLVRNRAGISITFNNPLNDEDEETEVITAVFFLVSPEGNPTQHLRMLAQIAGRVDEETFETEWDSAATEFELKHALLHHDHWAQVHVLPKTNSEDLIGKSIKDISLPANCLVAVINRGNGTIIPRGRTKLFVDDKLTIIGDPKGVAEINKRYPKSTVKHNL